MSPSMGADTRAVASRKITTSTTFDANGLRGFLDPPRPMRPPTHRPGRWIRRQHRRRPSRRVGVSAGRPRAAVPHTQPDPAAAVAAARHGATGQLTASVQHWPGIGEELSHLRPAGVDPASLVGRAQPVAAGRPVATSHRTHATSQHRMIRLGNVEIDAELREHHCHQLLQQARPHRRRALGRPHSWTSDPVKQPAASNVAQASSTVR